MRVLIIAQYFPPEEVGAGIWIHQLAADLLGRGHTVTVLTAFPNYPRGEVFEGYRKRLFHTETRDGIRVARVYIYATARRTFWRRVVSFGSFCTAALLRGLALAGPCDVIYAILPPLPLGVTAAVMAKVKNARLVINIQDLYPYLAAATGYLRNGTAIRFFERMEEWIYRQADRAVVISEGFREHVLRKGTASERVTVIPNWADPDQIRPGSRFNFFRDEVGCGSDFMVLYSGGLGHNTAIQPLLEAAEMVKAEPFRFVIIGEGAQKAALVESVRKKGLTNIVFWPFQPLERYGEVLAAADITVVALSSPATLASVPSKVYKQMAAARPILAITEGGNELQRLIDAAGCGFCVAPSEPGRIAQVLREAADDPAELVAMGQRARQYLEENCARSRCIDRIEQALMAALLPAASRLRTPEVEELI